MKVLHLISGGDKGGAKTHVFNLLTALMQDIEIRVICFMEGDFYQEIKQMPIPSMLMRQRYRYDLTVVKRLVKHIRSEQYHIIHSHGARANFITMFLRKAIKIPIITTIHSDYRMDFTQNLYKKMVFTELATVSLRYIDYFIAVSESFKQMLSQRGFNLDEIYTVYNAMDFRKEINFCAKADFLKKYDIDAKGKTIVGIIGRFDKVKGHEIFLKAAIKILEKRNDVLFLLAGEGNEQRFLENLVKNNGAADNIKFLGFVRDIYSFLNAIDINVISSYSESFPYVLLEGAIMHKATVSTAVGGIPDLIKHNETGLLVPSGDYCKLAEQITLLIQDASLRTKLGDNLFEFASTNFSTEKMKNRHIEIYEDVLKRQREQNKLYDVMLSGYYGFNNSGDEAILGAIIKSLRLEKPDIKIVVLSKNPKQTSAAYDVAAISRTNISQIMACMPRCRLFLNGGGSLIQDITSSQSLFYYTFLMHHAKGLGLKVMLYANGIGPIIHNRNIKIARNALKICDCITLREPQSFNELERLNVRNENVSLSCDPTFVIEPLNGDALKEILTHEGISLDKSYVALSFRQWKYLDPSFEQKIASVINQIYNDYNLIPLFVPMQQPNDVIISQEIIQKLECPYILLQKEYNVQQLMGIISVAKLAIGMRLHMLIYAVGACVPSIGLVYDPKVRGFLEYVGQKSYVDISNINKDELLQMVTHIKNNEMIIRQHIENELTKLKVLSNNDTKVAIKLLENVGKLF